MSADEYREYRFAKRAAWLVNVLVNEGHRRVFKLRLVGDDGKWTTLETWISRNAHPSLLLDRIMRLPNTPLIMRIDCAKTLCAYQLKKPPRAYAPLTKAQFDAMDKLTFILNNPLDAKLERRQRLAAGQKEMPAKNNG
jgi:hypothetical protein